MIQELGFMVARFSYAGNMKLLVQGLRLEKHFNVKSLLSRPPLHPSGPPPPRAWCCSGFLPGRVECFHPLLLVGVQSSPLDPTPQGPPGKGHVGLYLKTIFWLSTKVEQSQRQHNYRSDVPQFPSRKAGGGRFDEEA